MFSHLDQLYDDCQPERAEKLQNQEIDYDLPGKGQHYCVPCGLVHLLLWSNVLSIIIFVAFIFHLHPSTYFEFHLI